MKQSEIAAKIIDSTPDQPLSVEETTRRLPAINLLSGDLREKVVSLSRNAPSYFWKVGATSSADVDYHHPLCRTEHGLWLHTLLQISPIVRLSESLIARDKITAEERDYAIAAAILHDQRKRGDEQSDRTSAASDHDLQMARVTSACGLPDPVSDAIAAHMGPSDWGYDGPEPSSPVEELVHTADMLASTPNIEPKVPTPVPEELASKGAEPANIDL